MCGEEAELVKEAWKLWKNAEPIPHPYTQCGGEGYDLVTSFDKTEVEEDKKHPAKPGSLIHTE